MAKLVFQSPEARDHFREVVVRSINDDCYFGKQGLHEKLEYLRTYADDGDEYRTVRDTDSEGGRTNVYLRRAECVIGWGRGDELSLHMRDAERRFGDEDFGPWRTLWIGGLVKHTDGTWGVHT